MTALLTGILATWRITSLFVSERGPYDVFGRLRDAAGITFDEASQPVSANELARALLCVWCTSVYIGGAVALLQGHRGRRALLSALAYSAGAIMIDRWTNNAG